MDELIVAGKKYISSKRAAELTGYAKDYVGQLIREGKLVGTRVGRAWFVEHDAILAFAGKTTTSDGQVDAPEPQYGNPAAHPSSKRTYTVTPSMIQSSGLPKTWSDVRYSNENVELFPQISRKIDPDNSLPVLPDSTTKNNDISSSAVSVVSVRTLPSSQPNEIVRKSSVLSKHPTRNTSTMRSRGFGRRATVSFALLIFGIFAFSSITTSLFVTSDVEYSSSSARMQASAFTSSEYLRDAYRLLMETVF